MQVVRLEKAACAKCGCAYHRDLYLTPSCIGLETDIEKAAAASSTLDNALCPDCEKTFIEWLEQEGYLSKDCWCKHIAEFVGEVRDA